MHTDDVRSPYTGGKGVSDGKILHKDRAATTPKIGDEAESIEGRRAVELRNQFGGPYCPQARALVSGRPMAFPVEPTDCSTSTERFKLDAEIWYYL